MRVLPVLVFSLMLLIGLAPRGAFCQAELPPGVDLRPQFDKFAFPARDQGNRDTCTIFAVTSLAEFEAARYTHQAIPFSEEFLDWAKNAASGLTGDQAMFYEATHGLQTFGICRSELMPYKHVANPVEKPSPQAKLEARSRRNWTVHWIKRWDVSTGFNERQIRQIKEALSHGHPVATGMRWPRQVKLSNQNVVHIPPVAQVFDGHTVTQVGYRDDPGQPGGGLFIFRTWSGPRWGDRSYGYLPYAYLLRYGNDSLWLEPSEDVSDRTVVLEGENLRSVPDSRCRTQTQRMSPWGGRLWSHGKQLFCNCSRGGSVTLAVPFSAQTSLEEGGAYHVSLLATMAPDYGRIQAFWNGKPAGRPFDCFNPRVQPTGPIDLGILRSEGQLNELSVQAVGKNASSSHCSFGIDAIRFVRLPVSEH